VVDFESRNIVLTRHAPAASISSDEQFVFVGAEVIDLFFKSDN
jgi:hypothetical protein